MLGASLIYFLQREAPHRIPLQTSLEPASTPSDGFHDPLKSPVPSNRVEALNGQPEALHITVKGTRGDYIEGAEVYWFGLDGRGASIGATDSAGLIWKRAAETRGRLVAFHSSGSGTLYIQDPARSSPVEILIPESWSISGDVIMVDGQLPPSNARVLAIPDDMPWPQSEIRTPPWVRTTSASDGDFILDGLTGESYSLWAIADGCVSSTQIEVSRGDQIVTMPMTYLYGALTCIQEVGGHALRIQEGAQYDSGPARVALQVPGSDVAHVPDPDRWSSLWNVFHTPPGCRSWLFTANSLKPSIGPILLHVNIPGYHPATATLEAKRWIAGEESLVLVELSPKSPSWYRLTISTNAPIAAQAAPQTRPHLHLRDLDGTLSIPISLDCNSPEALWIPQGSYELWFSCGKLWRYPPEGTIPLPFDRDQEFEVNARVASQLKAVLLDADGLTYLGRAGFRLRRLNSSVEQIATFAGPPFLFPIVSPGEWSVAAFLDGFLPPGHEPYSQLVTISPGQMQEVILTPRR